MSFPSALAVCSPGSTAPECAVVTTCAQGQYASGGSCLNCTQGFTTPGSGATSAGDCAGAGLLGPILHVSIAACNTAARYQPLHGAAHTHTSTHKSAATTCTDPELTTHT